MRVDWLTATDRVVYCVECPRYMKYADVHIKVGRSIKMNLCLKCATELVGEIFDCSSIMKDAIKKDIAL